MIHKRYILLLGGSDDQLFIIRSAHEMGLGTVVIDANDKAPGLRPLIPKMAEVSKDWAALVPRWDEVEASHLAEVGLGWTKARSAPKTYELMASILRPERVRA